MSEAEDAVDMRIKGRAVSADLIRYERCFAPLLATPPSQITLNMVLTLYGHAISTCTRRVGMVLMEKNVPFKFVAMDYTKAEHKTPEYLKKQPFGQVPYLDDDGFIVYESRAICRYICDKYPDQGTPLVPTELKAKALFEQACSIEASNFDPFAYGAFMEMYKLKMGVIHNKDRMNELLATLEKKLEGYEAILSKQKYLAGDEVSLADLFHIPYGSTLPQCGYNGLESGEKLNVVRWWKDISSRESWQTVKDGLKGTIE
ncbi:thioredoxin-like protein [Schizophyllum amplum]|uniref:glutathione transferase n=1 Tax=Schizophyllum amplum TaxID=97359 RepID=A0A550CII4_9AGAR|nr:thioredoxin-like protein [Auriculariopsis ampla]